MFIVGYFDDTVNRTFEEEFETEKEAENYMSNKIPAYAIPYFYDASKINEQNINIEEQKYYENFANKEVEIEQQKLKESEENYEIDL